MVHSPLTLALLDKKNSFGKKSEAEFFEKKQEK